MWHQRSVRKFISVVVCFNALATRPQLSKRTESHSREHLWSLGVAFVLPASVFLLLFVSGIPVVALCFYLPVVLLMPERPIIRNTGHFKGISTIFDSDSGRRVKIKTRHGSNVRKLQAWLDHVSRKSWIRSYRFSSLEYKTETSSRFF